MYLNPEAFAASRVLLVGDVMLDRYWSGGTHRISPEAPVPVVRLDEFSELPGGAANVALNVASLGVQTELVGLIGSDESAITLQRALDRTAVIHHLLAVDDSPTITKLRILSRNQHLMRLDVEDGFAEADHRPLLNAFTERLEPVSVVVLSDYAKGTLGPVTGELITAARERGRPVLVDPKGADFTRYRGATLLTPNRGEFEAVVGRCDDNEEIERRARGLIAELELEALLITRSDEGMTLVRRDQPVLHLEAHRREVYDVTGAGDTVIGVMAAALAAGHSLDEAAVLANHAAAVVVGHLGAAQVTLEELRAAIAAAQRVAEPGGVLTVEQLLVRVAAARARGERIVFTNGCFDLLHAGHLQGLRDMRALGDRLIVAVNDDASVSRLKGASRPVVPAEQRMALLAALDCVDWVVSFAEDTPAELISRVRPDILAKGGDYQPEEIVGHDTVHRHGGRVEIVPYREGLSTSELIRRICESH